MEIIFDEVALADVAYWKKSGNSAVQKRIQKLLQDIIKTPFTGLGKPEALKYDLAGKWSRRVTDRDRLVYSVTKNYIKIHSLRGHYL